MRAGMPADRTRFAWPYRHPNGAKRWAGMPGERMVLRWPLMYRRLAWHGPRTPVSGYACVVAQNSARNYHHPA